MNVQSQFYQGWVQHIFEPNDFDQRFVVANYRDDDMRDKLRLDKAYPMSLCFTLSVKNGANKQLDGINIGDLVKITYWLTGKSGVSKAGKYFAVNTLNVSKINGVEVLERARTAQPVKAPEKDDDLEDMPF